MVRAGAALPIGPLADPVCQRCVDRGEGSSGLRFDVAELDGGG